MHRHFRLPALAALFLTGAFSVWAADTPVKGGTLIYLEQQPHTNLYPPAGGFYPNGGILNQITDKLTWQNPKTLEIEPWIAESWTSNADKTEYTFHLRKGVKFHSNKLFTPTRDFNADDVIFSFMRQKDVNHPYHNVSNGSYSNFESLEFGSLITAIDKVDDRTVRFTLAHPEAPFVADLAWYFASILSAE